MITCLTNTYDELTFEDQEELITSSVGGREGSDRQKDEHPRPALYGIARELSVTDQLESRKYALNA